MTLTSTVRVSGVTPCWVEGTTAQLTAAQSRNCARTKDVKRMRQSLISVQFHSPTPEITLRRHSRWKKQEREYMQECCCASAGERQPMFIRPLPSSQRPSRHNPNPAFGQAFSLVPGNPSVKARWYLTPPLSVTLESVPVKSTFSEQRLTYANSRMTYIIDSVYTDSYHLHELERSTLDESIAAITDSCPPTTDDFTYLTIVETHLTPELLPTLNEILQDVELCQKIGWDLVHMLIPLKGSGSCLKTIACLGNPREVILQVTGACPNAIDLQPRASR